EGTHVGPLKLAPSQLAHFGLVTRGHCWLTIEAYPDAVPLTGGDCFLLAPGVSYILRDDVRTQPRNFCEVAQNSAKPVLYYGGGGAPTRIVSGFFSFDALSLKPLTELMPSLILVKGDQAHTPALHSTMKLLDAEMAEPAPGSEIVATRLAEVLFIQTIRAHISSAHARCERGWLRAIFDPQIGAAIRSIHENVSNPWTVESLAAAASMSRSAFAARFKELLGQSPIDYVTEWRMQKSLQLLRQKDKKLVDVARSVGYESDAGFNKAFRRVLGVTPGEYRDNGFGP
ncbi:MAG TPA: AraC family transcriptional regulator, partial [Bryobacteraceae bacterium]|nr:AraC family transcriptional regulator [Bryobacteraceae bacterium]